jgi:dipeptidyl aminopeptidase/acylaminoacyl peptidase
MHGSRDEFVPLPQGLEFAAALKKAGVPTELIVVKNGRHGMGSEKGEPRAEPNGDELRDVVTAFFDRTLRK